MTKNNQLDTDKIKIQRKERKKDFVKQEIIQTAEKYFLTVDFENVMIEQLAKLSGYSKATIYNYFESKEEIFLEIFIKAFDSLIETLHNFNFENGILSLGQGYLQFVDNYPNYAKLFSSPQIKKFTNTLHTKELTNQKRTDLEQIFREKQNIIAILMTKMIEQSFNGLKIKPDINPMTLIIILSYLNSTIIELIQLDKEQGKTNTPESYISVFFQIFNKGLKYFDT